jgi:hypothetical protein
LSLHFSSRRSLSHHNCINSTYNTNILKYVFVEFISLMKKTQYESCTTGAHVCLYFLNTLCCQY